MSNSSLIYIVETNMRKAPLLILFLTSICLLVALAGLAAGGVGTEWYKISSSLGITYTGSLWKDCIKFDASNIKDICENRQDVLKFENRTQLNKGKVMVLFQ